MLDITYTIQGGVDILHLAGELNAASVPQFTQQLEALFGKHRYRIVLDLTDLRLISSAGLHALVTARSKAREYTDHTYLGRTQV